MAGVRVRLGGACHQDGRGRLAGKRDAVLADYPSGVRLPGERHFTKEATGSSVSTVSSAGVPRTGSLVEHVLLNALERPRHAHEYRMGGRVLVRGDDAVVVVDNLMPVIGIVLVVAGLGPRNPDWLASDVVRDVVGELGRRDGDLLAPAPTPQLLQTGQIA